MKKILKYLLTILFSSIFFIWSSNAYLEGFEQYKNLKYDIMKTHNKEYWDHKINTVHKSTKQYKEMQNDLVKVETIFDINERKLEEDIQVQKSLLLEKIKNIDLEGRVWVSQIDAVISNLNKEWKYFVLEVEGRFIPIKEWEYLYVYPNRIKWNVNLIDRIQNVIATYNWKKKSDTDTEILENPDVFKETLTKLLDSYKIKYKYINTYAIEWNLYIWKNQNIKQSKKQNFFISKWFTTPDLEKEIEETKEMKNYIWTYITLEDLEYWYSLKNLAWAEVFAEIWWEDFYVWRLNDKEKYFISKFHSSNLDVYVYKIYKNNYEYLLFVFFIIFWLAIWMYLSINFLENFRANFKKIPEEI